jgi:DNA polymerase III subunit epsilon
MSVLDGPIVFVDVETNGLDHIRGRVIEVGAIRVEGGQVVREMKQLIDPGTPLPEFITSLTGIRESDLRGAPLFIAVADELYDILDGALFIAHNVRFDYSFLKQEFKRVGKEFRPQQLCTMRLSRTLFPEHRSHKLQSLIERHNFAVTARHRAYEDAQVLWQFIQLIQSTFDPELLKQAVAKQVKKPSLPKGLDPESLANLPDTYGVYIFEDADGNPLYVGKSVNIKKRVASHFAADHEHVGEFRMAQSVRNIKAQVTSGELSALLLESELIKQLMPMHNKMLRRTSKLILAKQTVNDDGYASVYLQEAFGIEPEDVADVLGIYTRRSQAKQSLDNMVKDWSLCPKLLGLEKSKGPCFLHQLHRCDGACVGKEPAESYNSRLAAAFEHHRIDAWPYKGPIMLAEKSAGESQEETSTSVIIDQWCILAHVHQEPYCEPVIKERPKVFDLDTYKILRSYITRKISNLTITPVSYDQLAGLR